MDHFTAAGFTPLYDPARQAWSEDFCEGNRRPRPPADAALEQRDRGGLVTAEAAAATGLAVGTPVVCGTIRRRRREALSVGVVAPGDMMVMYGSTIFIIQVTAAQVARPAPVVRALVVRRPACEPGGPFHQRHADTLAGATYCFPRWRRAR